MTGGTPAGFAQRCTIRDDKAEHQIRITAPGARYLFVSCTCRKRKPIASITTTDEAWAAWRWYHAKLVPSVTEQS